MGSSIRDANNHLHLCSDYFFFLGDLCSDYLGLGMQAKKKIEVKCCAVVRAQASLTQEQPSGVVE
jgi:hypothetical protein